MRKMSLNLLRSVLRGKSADSWSFLQSSGACATLQGQQILSSRSFSADAEGGESGSKEDDKQAKKTELGRWWQAFSEQSRGQHAAGNAEKTAKEQKGSQWFIPKKTDLGQGQEQSELTSKGGGSRWFLPPKEASRSEQEAQEITSDMDHGTWGEILERGPSFLEEAVHSTIHYLLPSVGSKQVGARWLASTREKLSTDTELADLSSIPWFGSSGETPASERERLEVSLLVLFMACYVLLMRKYTLILTRNVQRLALMSKLGENNQAPSFMFLPPKDNLLRKYFHWDNLSSPEKHKIELEKVRRNYRIHPTDCGSSQVQIALLTNKIKYMTKHMETHRKDYHSRKGLEAMVQQRRRLLKYLRRKDWESYCDVITKLGLRDNVMDASSKRKA